MLALCRASCKSGAPTRDRCSAISSSTRHTGPMSTTEAPSVPATARERARAQVKAELLDAARARLESDGAAGLSLRAVARDLGVASSAVYRYVESRDALLTLLIIETYDAVGAVAEQAAAHARAS